MWMKAHLAKHEVAKVAFENAPAYEQFMGRWSRQVGRLFVLWLKITPHARWLDVGCGTGAFSDVILSECEPSGILAFDPSAEHVEFARSHINDERVQFTVGDVTAIAARNSEFDVAVAALVLNFMSAQRQAVKEMCRVVRPGGVVAAYVWDFAAGRHISQHLTNAVAEVVRDAAGAFPALNSESTTPEAL